MEYIPVSNWDVCMLASWLEGRVPADVVRAFIREEIRGSHIPMLTEKHLEKYLEVHTLGARFILLAELRRLDDLPKFRFLQESSQDGSLTRDQATEFVSWALGPQFAGRIPSLVVRFIYSDHGKRGPVQQKQQKNRVSIARKARKSLAAGIPVVTVTSLKSRVAKRRLDENPILSKYDLKDKIGQGTFSSIYRIVNKNDPTDQKALKITNLVTLKEEEQQNCKNEITLMRPLDHPNIVKVFEDHCTKENLFLVQDLLPGGELFDRIVEVNHFSELEAARIVRQIASALKYLHARNIIHRDIKPENLMLSDKSNTFNIKLVDFGLSVQSEKPLRIPCGTPGYVSPEMLKHIPYHKEIDIWSLGVVTYILLCGYVPFSDEAGKKTMFMAIRNGVYGFPDEYWKGISKDAKCLIRRMLTVDPGERISAAQLLHQSWLRCEPNRTSNSLFTNTYMDAMRRTSILTKLQEPLTPLEQVVNKAEEDDSFDEFDSSEFEAILSERCEDTSVMDVLDITE